MSSTSSINKDFAAEEKSIQSLPEGIVKDTVNAADEYTDAQFKRLLRKTDLILLPLLWLSWGLVQADKGSISSQATFGLTKDLHLKGQEFNWLSTLFFLAYLVAELPANWIMQKVHVGRTIGTFMVLWGLVVLLIAQTHNFTQIAMLRFIQGVLECSIGPGFLVLTGSFYAKREHVMRSFVWGTAPFSFGAISDLCIYGLTKAAQNGKHLAPWKGISYFLGGLTILTGLVSFFFLGTPREVFWLSEEEKRMTAARTVGNQTGTDRQKRSSWDSAQAKECLRDPQVYFFFFTQLVNGLPNGGVTTFGNLVLKSFGFSSLDAILKGTLPRNVYQCILFLCLGALTLKFPQTRFMIMMGCLVPAIIGMFLLAFLPNHSGLLWVKWALFLLASTGGISGFLVQTFIPSNIAGRTKKTIVLTVVFVGYAAGNAIGAQVFRSNDAPRYIKGIAVCASMYALELSIMCGWRIYYGIENNRRNKAAEAAGISEEERERLGRINAEEGMTDIQNQHFRYAV